MAELPPRPRLLAVPVQVRAGDGQDRRRVRLPADHVDHRDVLPDADAAERKSTDRAQVVLELARLRALDRPVPGVVHARRHLVAEQRRRSRGTARSRARRRSRVVPRSPRACASAGAWSSPVELRRRRVRHAQDPVAVVVLDERVAPQLAVGRAHGDDRQLAVERHERLQDRRHLAHRAPGVLEQLGGCGAPPAPCRRIRAAASSAPPGGPPRRRPTASDGRSSTAANVGTGSPTSVKSVFSAIRSCAASSAHRRR